jgi:hypothetical protein
MKPIFGVKLPYKIRCNLPDCRKPVNQVFRITIDSNPLTFCSSNHARVGEERWEEKKKLNIRMDVPVKEEKPDMVGDNLQELEGGE